MKQVLIKQGKVLVEEVPAPVVTSGTVLVKVANSCISTGTESAVIAGSAESLLKRAMRQPEKIKQVLNIAINQGINKAINLVGAAKQATTIVGYSCSGVVIDKGKDVSDINIGDKVACAGSEANHAEIVCVPRNLVAGIPEGVGFPEASTTTLGAIAMQGIRRATPTLGETFVVIGLGVLGQITVQLLKASGCNVIGIDLDLDRIKIARSLGMDLSTASLSDDAISQIKMFTNGFGVDGAIITAATSSSALVSSAFKMCRKKGRVVLVGDVGLDLKREDFYQKEIDFLISTSYGPGRYEPNYEDKGLDYPISYVRWTENRNMQAYLHLLKDGSINIKPLIEQVFDINDADKAYGAIDSNGKKPVITLLDYSEGPNKEISRKIANPLYKPANKNKTIGVAVVGAGIFAKETHLPNLKSLSHLYHLEAVQNKSGANAKITARQFGARYATTDFQEILDDKNIGAVIIATRHDLHAELILKALKAGKHVLVEKPLALKQQELDQIVAFYQTDQTAALPVLLTGFNRRFSVYLAKIKTLTQERSGPMIINYVMNAGYIPLDHWVHTEEGGGRNIGEACHIYDLFTFLTGAKVKNVDVKPIRTKSAYYSENDNFVAAIQFEDGSVANLIYTALGSSTYPKEKMELFFDGKVLLLDNYKTLTINASKKPVVNTKVIDKGHKEELVAFANTILNGGEWPIPLWQQIQATEISFKVEERIRRDKR
ncbi:oxidoreductase [Candidatus Saganbacteria bacterium CG08_land_8_20_14_0_20_45_16]|uniref:Oxidoreductase n=1 Tax=Candidatus Saganbacteria bacterium CG08_land_8_20_14_0_20_45_16 TaxID=2014293 RepID=A0A2H0XZ56_UNCSA|nr:MAG: oxidoreductase [Candidatus Saganbacteria bacterium CG08_land_8_20_14_0_20_45_16]